MMTFEDDFPSFSSRAKENHDYIGDITIEIERKVFEETCLDKQKVRATIIGHYELGLFDSSTKDVMLEELGLEE